MTIQDLGSIGELVGAIATVATLIYLAIQVRANTRASKASSIQYMLDGARDRIIIPNVVHPDVSRIMSQGMTDLDGLQDNDKVRFLWILTENVLQLQNVLTLRNEKMLSEADYETWLHYVGALVRTSGGRELWPQLARVVSQDVREALDKHLADEPDLPSLLEFYPVMNTKNWK